MPNKVDVMVFDSGVGGLSVLDAIHRKAPDLSYCFVGDNAGLPYGNKSETWLAERVPAVVARALQEIDCQLLVVACNTASTVVLPPLRRRFAFPVVGVVPAIKPAAALSKNRIIGLLATPATVQRSYTNELIAEFANDCQVIRVGSSRLVAIAEDKLRGISPDPSEIRDILGPLIAANPDVVVLGCTHFPLLALELEVAMPHATWIDSGEAIANRVIHFIKSPGARSLSQTSQAFFTQNDIELKSLSGFGINELHFFNDFQRVSDPW